MTKATDLLKRTGYASGGALRERREYVPPRMERMAYYGPYKGATAKADKALYRGEDEYLPRIKRPDWMPPALRGPVDDGPSRPQGRAHGRKPKK